MKIIARIVAGLLALIVLAFIAYIIYMWPALKRVIFICEHYPNLVINCEE